MEKNREEKIEQIQLDFQKLPIKWQRVIVWVVENWEIVEVMCKDTTMTIEEMEENIREARTRGDASMEILNRLAKRFKEQKSE